MIFEFRVFLKIFCDVEFNFEYLSKIYCKDFSKPSFIFKRSNNYLKNLFITYFTVHRTYFKNNIFSYFCEIGRIFHRTIIKNCSKTSKNRKIVYVVQFIVFARGQQGKTIKIYAIFVFYDCVHRKILHRISLDCFLCFYALCTNALNTKIC